MGDRQIAREMLECFCDNMPGLIETLQGHIADSDQGATLATVKKILSIATCSSAIAVQECAVTLEHAAKTGNMTSIRAITPLLELRSLEAIGAIQTDCSDIG